MVSAATSSTAFEFSITISGLNMTSGTFSDSRGLNGVWTVDLKAGTTYVTLNYTDWSDFVLTGKVFDMSGSYAGEGTTGSWTATRTDSARGFASR
jgi:hypothetical protein